MKKICTVQMGCNHYGVANYNVIQRAFIPRSQQQQQQQ